MHFFEHLMDAKNIMSSTFGFKKSLAMCLSREFSNTSWVRK
uniref:Uncharacterized protein n=1 Tax=Solanum lycopersicum TaxID=4081 RepID=A0A3Q7EVA9_SOLLC